MKIAIIGSGSWGSAMAKLLSINGHNVKIWTTDKNVYNNILNGENPTYLPGISLPKSIKPMFDLDKTVEDVDIIVLAIPSQAMREVVAKIKNRNAIFVSLAKGLEIKTGKLMNEIIKDELGNVKYCALSGPSHAEEVARDIPTSIVASGEKKVVEIIQKEFSNVSFRVYTNEDLKGVELCGAVKNVYAIASGVIDGIGGWDNTKAALITRSLVEISRFVEALGGKKETIMGLAGIGDLIVTCTSQHSRNRHVGEFIGKGYSLENILNDLKMVAEGVYTAKALYNNFKKEQIEMPIAEKVYKVLYEKINPKEAIEDLMNRKLKSEN
ncbi:glycerol-3-phosphate dehydrogenase [NAD(P)+] [Tepiditoga spiralis]|uniref:Glycerol-3-phosphate dehydrogenase [NAD(P)+] n=1 Tax=Tepiditoga spiralis TaxID=2108365 RepID=A0A7G1G4J2_9BACT|nr:NAD(P)H-dependent glycerol-3-phosphate dehydrogenase [Tepiditoga spiralis]BBE31291.1 glycerol-3-phosphate dehydrogenase [NAD(P)+] [Tepiditoga spiralis]